MSIYTSLGTGCPIGFHEEGGFFSPLHPTPFRRLNIKRRIYRISYSIRLLPSRLYKITRDSADVRSYNSIPSLSWGSSISFSNDSLFAYRGIVCIYVCICVRLCVYVDIKGTVRIVF